MTSLNSLHQASALGDLGDRVDHRLQLMREQHVIQRIWDGGHTVWQPQDAGISSILSLLRHRRRVTSVTLDKLREAAT